VNVELRPLVPADAEISVRWRGDPSVWTYTLAAGRPPVELATEREWIERVIADPTGRRFAILADNRYVGNVYLTDIADGAAQYHIFIGDRDMWGRGIARAATVAVLDVAWRDLLLNRVYLLVHPDNQVARGLYERLGFTVTGSSGVYDVMTLLNNVHRE
jgi:diamine N-acetyltransferase